MYTKEEKKQLIHNFWTAFDEFCVDQYYLAGRKKTWMLHRTKVKNVHLRFDPGRDSVQVGIEINHRNEEQRIEMFEKLLQYRMLLEEGFENGLQWEYFFERENGEQVCRIFYEKEGLDFHRTQHWPAIFEFMASNMYLLEQNFLDISDLINS